MSEQTVEAGPEVRWDGRIHGYEPGPDWRERIAGIPLHSEHDDEIDPITYQVIRNRLFSINIAHGERVTHVSGSPVFQTLDFNMCILTEDAEYVMNAPYITFLNSGASYTTRYVMERYATDPGIHDGDLYICNDPWIGAVHEMDVTFIHPVFIDGRIFGWVSNAGHQYDLGGIVPGGWPQNARDVYSDPTIFGAIKLIEKGKMRPDVEAMYLRQSRMPDVVALDVRAQISGCRFAASALLELCAEFGPKTVKAAMRRVLDACQQSFEEKLSRIPDGTWSEVRYIDEKMPDDRGTYRVQVSVTKRGNRLIIDNRGSEPQTEGPTGVPRLAFTGAAVAALNPTLLPEHLLAVGGAMRNIDFDLEPGLINCADYPAAVSAGVLTCINQIAAVQNCINRMIACDDKLAEKIIAPTPDYVVPILTGVDAQGNYYGSALPDSIAPGMGARSNSDGFSSSGNCWAALSMLQNVEDIERSFPVIYLYRRDRPDSGGAGRWRAGTGHSYAFMPYGAVSMSLANFGGGMILSAYAALGTMGGLPAPSHHVLVRRETDVLDHFAARRIPPSVHVLKARQDVRRSKQGNEMPIGPTDVVEYLVGGGGGYGDPLEREPCRVALDVMAEDVTSATAAEVYGVVLGADGTADEAATHIRRRGILDDRSRWTPVCEAYPQHFVAARAPADGTPRRRVHEALVVRDAGDERVIACDRCDTVICGYGDDFKRHVLMDERSPTALPGSKGSPQERLDVEVVLRRYCCPKCFVLLGAEVARADDEPWSDMVLTVTSGARANQDRATARSASGSTSDW
jgi:N-methylhydantoinase B